MFFSIVFCTPFLDISNYIKGMYFLILYVILFLKNICNIYIFKINKIDWTHISTFSEILTQLGKGRCDF